AAHRGIAAGAEEDDQRRERKKARQVFHRPPQFFSSSRLSAARSIRRVLTGTTRRKERAMKPKHMLVEKPDTTLDAGAAAMPRPVRFSFSVYLPAGTRRRLELWRHAAPRLAH